jgi:ABC-2 type transport system ATP-binding protein
MIRMHGVGKRFGSVYALRGVTIDVPEGSVFALLGPNGAGKSTAIKICLNLLRPSSGRAEVLGCDSRRLGAGELAQIGFVSESRALPDWMRVDRFFAYTKEFYPGWREDELSGLVRQFEVPLDRPLKALSRGMRVKAALAAALCYRPRLLILDEPFSGLDALVREQLIEALAERSSEMTVLLASHDLAEIESFATHVAYLDEGSVGFVEEMGDLSARFREIEVTGEMSGDTLPPTWLNVERGPGMVRFVDSRFDPYENETALQRYVAGARDVTVRPMPLRSILVALARAARNGRS